MFLQLQCAQELGVWTVLDSDGGAEDEAKTLIHSTSPDGVLAAGSGSPLIATIGSKSPLQADVTRWPSGL